MGFLLIAVAVLGITVRAGPGDAVAGHAPGVFMHAVLADGKSAPAPPAEHEGLSAAMALATAVLNPFFPAFPPPGGLGVIGHDKSVLLLSVKR
jgi:hypothetical protein